MRSDFSAHVFWSDWPQNNTFACILLATSTSPTICWYLIGNTFKHRVSLTDMVITVDSFDKCIWQIGWKYMPHNLFLKQQSTTPKLRSVYVLKQRTVQQILLFGLGYGLGFACFSKLKKRWPFFSYFCLFFLIGSFAPQQLTSCLLHGKTIISLTKLVSIMGFQFQPSFSRLGRNVEGAGQQKKKKKPLKDNLGTMANVLY